MKTYFYKVLLVVLATMLLDYLVLFTVRSPLPASYGVRQLVIVKRYLAGTMASPKVVILGGSSTIFGIDASLMETELGMPAINFGLHAAMRLEAILNEARQVVKPGDIVILALEGEYYNDNSAWTEWQLRNELALNPAKFDALPFLERLRIFYQASSPSLAYDLCASHFTRYTSPNSYQERINALRPEPEVVAQYLKLRYIQNDFSYDIGNLDDHGDMRNAFQGHYLGYVTPLTMPGSISNPTKVELARFIAEMKERNVRVFFTHTPYIVEGPVKDDWKKAEEKFLIDLHSVGGVMLEERDELFFPRSDFFDTRYHLNTIGRALRTHLLIDALKNQMQSHPSGT